MPLALLWLTQSYVAPGTSLWLNMPLTLALVIPMGPMVYRIVHQPLAEATVLVLLIVSVAVHFALTGLALVFFGAEGRRTPAFVSGQVDLGFMTWSAQSLFVVATCAILIVGLWLFFGKTLYGRAARHRRQPSRRAPGGHQHHHVGQPDLHAGHRHRRDVGHADRSDHHGLLRHRLPDRPEGLLSAPSSAAWRAIPAAAAGSLLVGVLESFSSFWASAYKEVIVFTLIIPVLVWRSFSSHHVDEEE